MEKANRLRGFLKTLETIFFYVKGKRPTACVVFKDNRDNRDNFFISELSHL